MALAPSDCFRFKLLRILETAGESVLRYTLLCGTDGKPPNVPLDEYLKSLSQSSTANFNNIVQKHIKRHPGSSGDMPRVYQNHIKKQFNDTDLSQITSDPSCSTFDITLLHKAIKVACENVAEMYHEKWKTPSNEVEYLVTKVKELRNEIVHEKRPMSEQDYLDEVKKLRVLFSKVLEATMVRYNRDQREFTVKNDEVMKAVETIKKQHFGPEEILQGSSSQLLPLLKKEANKEVKEKLGSAKYLDPLHFLSGHENTRVDVHDIFSEIIINEEMKAGKTIHHSKIINLTRDGRSPSSPHILMLQGDAGSGKTTLLTYLLAEWLKEEPHRHMESLEHFDLLLWVVCREESSPTLESLVERSLPDAYVKYGQLLLPLLKKCRILILIDGLDEQNDVSRPLVKDIMNQGKDCPTFTVICTSRPEGITGMKANTPKNFMISHLTIVGLSAEERTDLAVTQYKLLSRSGIEDEDEARLREVMQQIGWREIFRLPLNVLFLATMYHFEPQKLKTVITQSELYQYIHSWCVEKLLHRLARHSQVAEGILLREHIESILSVCYEVALRGLIQNNIYLSKKDRSYLTASCKLEGLPELEVLSAFYSLRREVKYGVPKDWYCAPHKGLQEFFAAHHILGRLCKYKQGDILRVLKDSTSGQDLQLRSLRNLFCHLLGLLSRQDEPMAKAVEETVDLIHESGVEDTDDWLTVLADTEADPYTMARVAHHIKRRHNDEDYLGSMVDIGNGTVHVAAALLPRIPRERILIELEMDPAGMDVLVQALADHTVQRLHLMHHYKYPHPAAASAHLLQQVHWSHLTDFAGYLDAEHLQLLPRSLKHLRLVVKLNTRGRRLLSALEHMPENFPHLCHLMVHVPVSPVIPRSLTPLPCLMVFLFLSGVGEEEVEAAIRIAADMCPREVGHVAVKFPDASLDFCGCCLLLRGLESTGVRVDGSIHVPDDFITREEEELLCDLTLSSLGCVFEREDDGDLWEIGSVPDLEYQEELEEELVEGLEDI